MTSTAEQREGLGLAWALGLALLSGCATEPLPSRTAIRAAAMPPGPATMIITWTPNYVQTNEATGIESSPDLANWVLRFMGHTNTCTLLATNQKEFYRAFNIETNI